jgi:hypothetical protein
VSGQPVGGEGQAPSYVEAAAARLVEAAEADRRVGGLEDGGRAGAGVGPVELALVLPALGPPVLEPDLQKQVFI